MPSHPQKPPSQLASFNCRRRPALIVVAQSGQKCAILYTIAENCRRLGINPKEYLTDVLTRLPSMQAKDAVTLTPANCLKARNGKPERMVA